MTRIRFPFGQTLGRAVITVLRTGLAAEQSGPAQRAEVICVPR